MKRCFIVGAGDFYGKIEPDKDDLVIAADGGFDTLIAQNVRCDVLVGDLDSITPEANWGKTELIKYKKEKDETDMFLSYLEGTKRGYSDFYIYGGTGGREDHTFANYCLLLYIREHGGRAKLYSKNAVAEVIKNETVTIHGIKGNYVSVFALGSSATGVSIKGLKYECNAISLHPAFPLGVSNEFLDKEATIGVEDGALLIIKESY